MNTFAKAFETEAVKGFTENGAVCLTTTGDANLDFFGRAGGMRGNPEIVSLFRKAMDEDIALAVKNLFFLRDIRNGVGERSSFNACFRELMNRLDIEQFAAILEFIPEYGRWSDLFACIHDAKPEFFETACQFVREQAERDYANMEAGRGVSLLAKWFPLANNRHNPEAIRFARKVSAECFGTERNARKLIVPLRRHIGVLEQLMSANEWDKVEYSKMPSCAGLKYRGAFLRHDAERYTEWLSSVERGEAKMNAGAVMPYDLVRKAAYSDTGNDPAIDLMWKNLPDWTNGASSIVVADVSGSMYGSGRETAAPAPIFVSTSLAMYFAEKSKGPFKDITITFSEHPKCHKLDPSDTIRERFLKLEREGGFNTDIEKVFELYISLAKEAKPEDCPKNLVIISDMEFDSIENLDFMGWPNTQDELFEKIFKRKETLFKSVDRMFEKAGIARPTLVFWNVNSRQANVPVSKDEFGTVLVSGFSPAIFQYIVEGDVNPMKFMLKTLSNYDCILERTGIA